ncbi:MAG: winged helix-turn-helix domain-containing tetratricopeptide repeat protein [Pyrinomonadaceae bacterium]
MNEPETETYAFNEFRVDAAKRLLTKGDGEEIQLTPKVFDTLLYLVRNGGKVIEKDELMRQIWTDSIVEENNLNQNISILRRVFGEKPGEQRFIVTVAGHGYRFVPEVRETLSADTGGSNGAELAGSDYGTKRKNGTEIGHSPAKSEARSTKAYWLTALAVVTVLGLGTLGFYLSRGSVTPADTPIKTIAILPFKPLVIENRNEALELGMADALIAKLSGGEEVVVRPLSAIRRFNSVEQDSLSAGRELGVESVLDGTIQTWGDRIRVSAKLLRTADGKQMWAEQFDERSADIFIVQDSISEKVATALKIRLGGKRNPTENIEAYQLYMKGRYHIAKGTPPDLKASIPFFVKAIEIDPDYALAYTGLSRAYGVLGLGGDMTIPDTVARSRAAERRALELDDTLGEAHLTRCMGAHWYDWNWQLADIECRRAIEIDPGNSEFRGHYAMVLSSMGRHAEALAEAKRSRELNPVDLSQSALEGLYLLHAGRTDDALDRLRKTSELEPNFWMPHIWAASAYIEKGMYAEAVAASNKEKQITGDNLLPFGAYAMAKSGNTAEARAVLEELLKFSPVRRTPSYSIALIYNALDESDRAMAWLEIGYEHHDPNMTFLKVEPKWNNLRNKPRFIDLMKRMNF